MVTNVVYASRTGARLDSHVRTGGGTDDTAVLQKTLDMAKECGGLHLIMDGAALVSGLVVHGHTTIECPNKGCGFFLADGANRSLITNVHPSAGEIVDRDISLLGGTYNHNCLHQAHHLPEGVHYSQGDSFVVAISFFGVEDLLVKDVTVRNQRTFAFLIANWRKVTMENISLELPDLIPGANQDGIHFLGPGRFLLIKNVRGRTGDDLIAINADEEFTDEKNFFHPYASTGPITDVVVDTVMVDDASQILRVLSRKNLVDRITVRNVTGTYRSFGFYLSAWDYHKKGYPGNFGSLVFENIDVRQTKPDYTYTEPFLFRISGKHRSLMLKNIRYFDPSDDRTIVQVEGGSDIVDIGTTPADVDSLLIDGLHIQDAGRVPQSRPYIMVRGRVKQMTVRNCEVFHGDDKKNVLIATDGEFAGIERLVLNDVVTGKNTILIEDREGKIRDCRTVSVFA